MIKKTPPISKANVVLTDPAVGRALSVAICELRVAVVPPFPVVAELVAVVPLLVAVGVIDGVGLGVGDGVGELPAGYGLPEPNGWA